MTKMMEVVLLSMLGILALAVYATAVDAGMFIRGFLVGFDLVMGLVWAINLYVLAKGRFAVMQIHAQGIGRGFAVIAV